MPGCSTTIRTGYRWRSRSRSGLLADRADLVRQDGAWTRGSRRELPVPPTVRDAVLERLVRLGAAARRVLTAAAVLAGPIDEALLGRVAGLREDQAWAGIRAARAAGLLHEDEQGRVSFRHVLMGRAVYQAAPALERRHYHRAAGEVLADLDPPPVGQLARHFREAGETTRWARYVEQAASQAADSGDRVTAVSLLDELVATAELPVPTRTRLAATLADTAVLGWEAVDQARQQVVGTLRAVLARPGLSPAEQAAIRNPLGRLLMQHGHWDAGRQELVQAVDHLAHDPMEAARVMGYLGLPIGPGPAAVHLSWLRRAAELEPLIRSPLDRLVLAVDRAAALLALGEEAGWTAAQLPPAAPGVEWQYQLARGQFNTGSAALVWGRYQTARQQLAAARELADRHRFARLQARIPVSQAWLDWLTGAWQGLAGRLAALTPLAADPVAPFQVVLLLGLLRSAQGEPRLAGRLLERALGDAGRLGQTDETVAPAAALARVRLAEGRPGEALRVTDQPMDTIAAKRVWIWAADIAPVRLEGLLAADRTDQARRLISDFARGLRGRAAPAPHAALATCRAILLDRTGGDQRRAATAYGRAAAAWQRLPRPYDALLCRERQAACLLASGRVEAGRTRLVEVHSDLSRLGASGDADRVGQRLRELGVEVRRPWRGGRRGYGDRLSPRELEVVRLVAAGRTNREIAAALSRSQHTVATQVHSAMRKLGVPSRTALAVSAVQAGVVARAPGEAGW